MSLELPFGIKRTTSGPLDPLYGPYVDVAAALAGVPTALRLGKTVKIGAWEYWWRDGTTDGHLIPKVPSGGKYMGDWHMLTPVLPADGDGSGENGLLQIGDWWLVNTNSNHYQSVPNLIGPSQATLSSGDLIICYTLPYYEDYGDGPELADNAYFIHISNQYFKHYSRVQSRWPFMPWDFSFAIDGTGKVQVVTYSKNNVFEQDDPLQMLDSLTAFFCRDAFTGAFNPYTIEFGTPGNASPMSYAEVVIRVTTKSLVDIKFASDTLSVNYLAIGETVIKDCEGASLTDVANRYEFEPGIYRVKANVWRKDNTISLTRRIAMISIERVSESEGSIATESAVIDFDQPRTYGVAAPLTGNITLGTKVHKRIVQTMRHNDSAEPTYPAAFKKLSGSGNYVAGVDNYYVMEYFDANTILYTINQIV